MIRLEPNSYSQRWFKFFHIGIAETRTTQEIDFVCACAPLPGFRKVVDVCCGMGRHARALFSRGYSVTGVERDAVAIAKARELAGGPSYLQADVRDYQPDIGAYDLAIVMSQSFGHFDAATNRDLLRRLATGVRRGRTRYPRSLEPGILRDSSGGAGFRVTRWDRSRKKTRGGRSALCAPRLPGRRSR